MKSYDFGQFLFNSSFVDEEKLSELIIAAKNKNATLATKALFLRMVTLPDLKNLSKNESLEEFLRTHNSEVQGNYDEIVKSALKPNQSARLARLKESSSIWLVQELIDSGTVDAAQLEKLLDEYHNLEVSPIEQAFSERYETLTPEPKPDYPLALDVVKVFHEFASESFESTIILLPDIEPAEEKVLGATVKVKGSMPVIVGIFAPESVFTKFAQNYNNLVEDVNDAFDVVSEFLNIYAGHLTIQFVATTGNEEEPETPRHGEVEIFSGIKMLSDCGNFYLYVGNEEYFSSTVSQPTNDLDELGDLSQFGLADFDDDFDEKFKDPFDF